MKTEHLLNFAAIASIALHTGLAAAQATTTPEPPPQVCIDNACTATSPSAPAGKIKWNPGHYMNSDSVLYAGNSASKLQGELNDLNNQNAVQGYRVQVTWGALEPTQGNYNFAVLDGILNQLKTSFNQPKHLVIYLWLYHQGGLGSNDGSVVPLYIQQNAAYGPSPVSGSYGWWGASSNGASSGMYSAALYHPAVMSRLIALVQALGAHYDGDPYVEAIEVQENATIAQCATAFPPIDPNYSDDVWLAQLERLLAATTAAFPHTNVIMDNSWFDRPADGVSLTEWMAVNRVAQGTSDSWGQSALSTYGASRLSDGIKTLLGVNTVGPVESNLRSTMPRMMAVEGMELAGNYFRKYGGPWTPADLLTAENQTYWASHVFWTHLTGSEVFAGGATVPAAAKWSNLVTTISATPLIHTEYPASYP